jgi:hypothetical protein
MPRKRPPPKSYAGDEYTDDDLPDNDEPGTWPAPRGHEPAEPAPAPDLPEPPGAPEAGGTVPAYLAELLSLPGAGADVLRGVNLSTAWVQIESVGGQTQLMPLAFLAPDALETLAEYGFQGHTTFEVRVSKTGRVCCYFAVRLPELEAEPEDQLIQQAAAEAGAGGSPALLGMLARQQAELAETRRQIAQLLAQQQQAQADPMAGLERAFSLMDRLAQVAGRLFQAAPAPAPQSDLGAVLDVVGKVAPLLGRSGGAEPPPEPPEAQG